MAITGFPANSGTTSTLTPVLNFGFTANAGDLIIMITGSDSGITGHTYGGSWVELNEGTHTGFRMSVAYLIAAGGETTDSLTGTGTADRWEAIYIRIPAGEWHGTTPPEINAAVTGSSTAPNPGSISPSWGSETNNIFIAAFAADDSSDFAISGYPANYTVAQTDASATTSSANIGAAVRLLTAASDDPGAFTISITETWRAQTIVVRPAGASVVRSFAQAQANIKAIGRGFAQAQADIKSTNFGFAQAQAQIILPPFYPVITVSEGAATTVDSASLIVTVPPVVSGDRLITIITIDGGPVPTWPANWLSTTPSPGLALGLVTSTWKYADIDGSEGWGSGGTFEITYTGNEMSTAAVIKIAAGTFHSDAPISIGGISGTSTIPDPASITPTPLDDYTFVAWVGYDDGTTTVSDYPSGYVNNQTNYRGNNSAGAGIGLSTRNIPDTDAAEDPATFTISASEYWIAGTIAIRGMEPPAPANYGHGQAQASIKQIGFGFGQAQASIKQTGFGFAQTQANIKATGRGFGQAQARISTGITTLTDTFTRTIGANGGWGTADSGTAWISSNTVGYSVNGSRGLIDTTTEPATMHQERVDTKDVRIKFQFTNAVVSNLVFYWNSKITFENHSGLTIVPDGSTLDISFNENGVSLDINPNYISTYDSAALYQVEIENFHTNAAQTTKRLRYRVYKVGDPIPDWYVFNYTTTIIAEGKWGGVAFSAASSSEIVEIDNINVTVYVPVASGQAQANIKATGRGFGQAQANIKSVGRGFGQANADIKATGFGFAQAQADIKQIGFGFGQAQAWISRVGFGFGQAQASIEAIGYGFAQAQTSIRAVGFGFGQAQARVKNTYFGHGQAQAQIKQTYFGHAQAQADIKAVGRGFAQAQANIKAVGFGFGQAQADIKSVGYGFGQSQAQIKTTYQGYGQAQAQIKQIGYGFGQAQADILNTYYGHGQAQGAIKIIAYGFGQSQSTIKAIGYGFGQAQAKLNAFGVQAYGQAQGNIASEGNFGYGQAQAKINAFGVQGYGQAQANIKVVSYGFGQAQADIKSTYQGYGQAQADILNTYQGYAQAQANIVTTGFGFGQAQGAIKSVGYGFGSAQAAIKATVNNYGQAQGTILQTGYGLGQAQATISSASYGFGQAQAYITANALFAFGQANALIRRTEYGHGQAVANIQKSAGYGQAQAYIRVVFFFGKLEISDDNPLSLTLEDFADDNLENDDSLRPNLTLEDSNIGLELEDSNINLSLDDDNYVG